MYMYVYGHYILHFIAFNYYFMPASNTIVLILDILFYLFKFFSSVFITSNISIPYNIYYIFYLRNKTICLLVG